MNPSYGPGFDLPFGALILLQTVAKPLSQRRGDGQSKPAWREGAGGGQRPAGRCACAPAQPAGARAWPAGRRPRGGVGHPVWGTLSSQPDPNSFSPDFVINRRFLVFLG